ncbi:UDP-N-acetylmuramoyl-tripeptide--D-alanyl-D-alanine ligase [Aliiroseovarius sediminilitoris]|uniref:UDP-N-acetylmuramoyl-tripeptide--D-alanyl-D-alanine ligase n=1 Tax=Aliiroseovarius sediminilitoris TaxID=1173584 RepID=A0A1I0P6E0_9RHOB|nr:UDP-N-acetylmuramoyl-tripeptide--D-alanyl-D-alanine ligase [Aliiroseovarius sediminilitoris]SEW09944.1 UDP-N-acetylmuramoyl-tripeptide--D-alanyl-D-alanine ligase [Aliiroseovarius sediminilitoris]
MTLWRAEDAANATGGKARGNWLVDGVSIDTRTLQPGDLFVALKDVRDGHDFVAQALEKGAGAAMISRIPDGVAPDAPLLIVHDVLAALVALGRAGRARTDARVVAVTGSVGKTSTKEMLRAVLSAQGRTHAAEASYNNHWGVPLTLARMPKDTEFAVIEIGMNHPGEIGPLSRLTRPHVAMVTTVAAAHLEAFDDLPGIAREKGAIFEGLEPGGIAVINGDLDTTPVLAKAAKGFQTESFGEGAANGHRLTHVSLTPDATICKALIAGEEQVFKIASPGRHFAMNALGALVAARALRADTTLAARAMIQWQPPTGRGTREEITLDAPEGLTVTLIDDAFNANPTSMAAALEVLGAMQPLDGVGRIQKGRRIAILGDMLELGPDEVALHADLADLPFMSAIDQVHCVGPRMRALWARLDGDQQGLWVDTAAEMSTQVRRLIDAGDVVLVKGSKGSLVSQTVDAIRKMGQSLR